jgi:soluble lytic murein transglycosylase-like protein
MLRKFAVLLAVLVAQVAVQAQDRPLSPPQRPPVPLTAADQERAQKEAAAKSQQPQAKPETQPAETAPTIKIPVSGHNRHISSGNPNVDVMVYEAAALHGLDPCLILSVMRAESGFNRLAVSPKGASGLMQLMPATATRMGVRNLFDPRENILGGAKYLRWLLNRFGGDLRLALAGYNAGEGAVEAYGNRIPPFQETQNYVRTIYTRYSAIHTNGTIPPVANVAVKPVEAAIAPAEKIPTYNQIIRWTSSTGDSTGKSSR